MPKILDLQTRFGVVDNATLALNKINAAAIGALGRVGFKTGGSGGGTGGTTGSDRHYRAPGLDNPFWVHPSRTRWFRNPDVDGISRSGRPSSPSVPIGGGSSTLYSFPGGLDRLFADTYRGIKNIKWFGDIYRSDHLTRLSHKGLTGFTDTEAAIRQMALAGFNPLRSQFYNPLRPSWWNQTYWDTKTKTHRSGDRGPFNTPFARGVSSFVSPIANAIRNDPLVQQFRSADWSLFRNAQALPNLGFTSSIRNLSSKVSSSLQNDPLVQQFRTANWSTLSLRNSQKFPNLGISSAFSNVSNLVKGINPFGDIYRPNNTSSKTFAGRNWSSWKIALNQFNQAGWNPLNSQFWNPFRPSFWEQGSQSYYKSQSSPYYNNIGPFNALKGVSTQVLNSFNKTIDAFTNMIKVSGRNLGYVGQGINYLYGGAKQGLHQAGQGINNLWQTVSAPYRGAAPPSTLSQQAQQQAAQAAAAQAAAATATVLPTSGLPLGASLSDRQRSHTAHSLAHRASTAYFTQLKKEGFTIPVALKKAKGLYRREFTDIFDMLGPNLTQEQIAAGRGGTGRGDGRRRTSLGRGRGDSISPIGSEYAGIAAAFAAAIPIRSALEFEHQTALIHKVMPEGSNFDKITRDIKAYSMLSGHDPSEIAQIAAFHQRAGFKDDPTVFSKDVLRASVAWEIPIEEVANNFAYLRTIFKLTQDELRTLSDVLNTLGNKTIATSRDILTITTSIGGLGQSLGLTPEQSAGVGAVFRSQGIPPGEVSTMLNMMFASIISGNLHGTEQQQAEAAYFLRGIGASPETFQNALPGEGYERLLTLFENLHNLRKFDPAFSQQVVTSLVAQRQLKRAIKPTGEGFDIWEAIRDILNLDHTGSISSEYGVLAATTGKQLEFLGNRVELVSIALGDTMLPMLQAISVLAKDVIPDIIAWTENNSATISAMITNLGAVAGVAIVSGIGSLFKHLIGSFLSGPDKEKGERTILSRIPGLDKAPWLKKILESATFGRIAGGVGAVLGIGNVIYQNYIKGLEREEALRLWLESGKDNAMFNYIKKREAFLPEIEKASTEYDQYTFTKETILSSSNLKDTIASIRTRRNTLRSISGVDPIDRSFAGSSQNIRSLTKQEQVELADAEFFLEIMNTPIDVNTDPRIENMMLPADIFSETYGTPEIQKIALQYLSDKISQRGSTVRDLTTELASSDPRNSVPQSEAIPQEQNTTSIDTVSVSPSEIAKRMLKVLEDIKSLLSPTSGTSPWLDKISRQYEYVSAFWGQQPRPTG